MQVGWEADAQDAADGLGDGRKKQTHLETWWQFVAARKWTLGG